MMRLTILVSCALLLSSCRNQGTNIVLASLNRSERIDLLCADGTQLSGNAFDFDEVLPLELCDSDVTFPAEVTPQFLGAVTQTESGTLAVVNFTGKLTAIVFGVTSPISSRSGTMTRMLIHAASSP